MVAHGAGRSGLGLELDNNLHTRSDQWPGSGCDVCKAGGSENIAQHSPGSSVILKSATVRRFQTDSNYSIKLLKENAPMSLRSVHGDIFMACCAECCRYCSVMTVQKRTGTLQSVIRWPLYTDIISGAGDHYNAVSLMTWTTCETWTLRVESHMGPLLIWEQGSSWEHWQQNGFKFELIWIFRMVVSWPVNHNYNFRRFTA